MTPEMKRSSYYVLFLGAKESKGLRGTHYIEPVLEYFISQEHRMQALKVTLQVSQNGLRIIPCTSIKPLTSSDLPTEKHFIPHSAITCVFQAPPPNDDIVSCILMIFNPDTNCPVHVHCYRCDSSETATILKTQLETFVNREDNQRKLQDIESRLQSKGLLPCLNPIKRDRGTPDFDCRTSDSSENSDRGFGSGSGVSNLTTNRVASLYDSLAAELRAKFNSKKPNTPLLLPPRDYDTIHRQRGNLTGIEVRRCSNPAVVGGSGQLSRRSYASREQESCGRSSGIGSAEDNYSPVNDIVLDPQHVPSSSDDEDWSPSQLIITESSKFLVRPTWSTESSPAPATKTSSSPQPPPLPRRPELRQRSPDLSHPPPIPVFSRERFEGVKQKWEKLDHQYVKEKSRDSFDDGYRSKEPVDADYRRQLSRESLLRSLSRSKTGSRDSLDRWVENGARTRSMWRKVEDDHHLFQIPAVSRDPTTSAAKLKTNLSSLEFSPISSNPIQKGSADRYGGYKSSLPHTKVAENTSSSGPSNNNNPGNRGDVRRLNSSLKNTYKELDEQERFPGLDRHSAKPLHVSTANLSQQHIYSEPLFETPQRPNQTKSKKFSFAFWK